MLTDLTPIATLPVSMFAVFAIAARITAILVFLPIPGGRNTPDAVRLTLGLCIAVSIALARGADLDAPSEETLVVALVSEAGYGIAIGLMVRLVEDAFLAGAQMIGLQAGFSFPSTIDPSSQSDSTALQICFSLATGLLFFSTGLHTRLIGIAASGIDGHPLGRPFNYAAGLEAITSGGAAIFVMALRLAMPCLTILLIVDLSLALAGRLTPQMQFLSLAFPAKLLVSLAVVGLTLLHLPALYEEMTSRMFESILACLR